MQNQPLDQQTRASAPATHAPHGASSIGMQPNLAALLSYLFVPVTSIIFLVVEKENRLVRFHALQSLLYGVALVVLSIALSIALGVVTSVVGQISGVAAFGVGLLTLFVWLGFLVATIGLAVWCMVKAYQGVMYKLPFVGQMAERMSAK